MKKCNNCQSNINDDALFCDICGAKQVSIAQNKFCQKCGTAMNIDAVYCPQCGYAQQQEIVEKKQIPKTIWYILAIVGMTIPMSMWMVGAFDKSPPRPPHLNHKPIATPHENANITSENNTTLELNTTVPLPTSASLPTPSVPKEIVNVKSSILTRENINLFLQSYLGVKCFSSVGDVEIFFSHKLDKYFSFKNPSHTNIYNENISYCKRWNTMDYQLNSFEILNGGAGNEIKVVAKISYHLTSDTKDIYSQTIMPMTLVDEFGAIKIKSVDSKKIQSTKKANAPTSKNKTYINPNSDELASYAYELLTGERMMNSNNMKITRNSKGVKIYCVEGVCKTEYEVLEYMR